MFSPQYHDRVVTLPEILPNIMSKEDLKFVKPAVNLSKDTIERFNLTRREIRKIKGLDQKYDFVRKNKVHAMRTSNKSLISSIERIHSKERTEAVKLNHQNTLKDARTQILKKAQKWN
jgi:hypothetical protein